MRGLRALRTAIVTVTLALATAVPSPALALGQVAAADSCVPGTVMEDPVTGVKYLCIYDEGYGGPHWVVLSTGQVGARGWLARSGATGCAYATVGLTGLGGDSGAAAVTRSLRWPCAGSADRRAQPPAELRSRIVIQVYRATGWATCRDSGFGYNTVTASGWQVGIAMGATPDCGPGTYRAVGFGSFYEASAWRGGSMSTGALWIP